jgi:hypothetical protein
MNGDIPASRLKPGYIGAYTVLSAMDYSACLQRVGDKVEVIGRLLTSNSIRPEMANHISLLTSEIGAVISLKYQYGVKALALCLQNLMPHGSGNGLV